MQLGEGGSGYGTVKESTPSCIKPATNAIVGATTEIMDRDPQVAKAAKLAFARRK